MFDFIKNLFSKSKQTTTEYTTGMVKVKTNPDGSFELSKNKEHGMVDGLYYTQYVENVKQLKREKKHPEAIELLLKLIDAVENESEIIGEGFDVSPWYYEQLAIIYRKDKRYEDEVEILERYTAKSKELGIETQKLDDRLVKAKSLLKSED